MRFFVATISTIYQKNYRQCKLLGLYGMTRQLSDAELVSAGDKIIFYLGGEGFVSIAEAKGKLHRLSGDDFKPYDLRDFKYGLKIDFIVEFDRPHNYYFDKNTEIGIGIKKTDFMYKVFFQIDEEQYEKIISGKGAWNYNIKSEKKVRRALKVYIFRTIVRNVINGLILLFQKIKTKPMNTQKLKQILTHPVFSFKINYHKLDPINHKTNRFLIWSCIIAGMITLLPLFFLIKIYYADYKENQTDYKENQFNYYLEKYIANNPSLFITKQTAETENNDAELSPFNYSKWIEEKIKEYPANIEEIIKNPKPEKVNYTIGNGNEQNISVKQIVQQNSPAVVLVYTIDSVLSWSYGTGFIIADNGIIATSYHLFGDIEEPDNIYAERGAIILSDNKSIYPISSVLFIDREKDLIVIKIDEKNKKLPTVKLGDSNTIEPGDEVFTIGNLHDHLGIILNGFVSGFIKDENIEQIQFSAFTTYGYSGGPLLNSRGQVIGVIAGGFTYQYGADFAIPINYLEDLINKK